MMIMLMIMMTAFKRDAWIMLRIHRDNVEMHLLILLAEYQSTFETAYLAMYAPSSVLYSTAVFFRVQASATSAHASSTSWQ